MKQLLSTLAACLLLGCTANSGNAPYFLQGAWVLQQVSTPEGHTYLYDINDGTRLRIYEGDSTMRECQLTQTRQALVVQPLAQCGVTLIHKGNDNWLYLEDKDPRPLTVANDSTIIIQRMGRLFTWRRANSIAREWGQEIKSIADRDLATPDGTDPPHYVLSTKEREQAGVIRALAVIIAAIVLLVLLVVHVALVNRRARRRLQLQLQQIEEEHTERPQTVRLASESVEATYFASDDYDALQRRIAKGQTLKDDDWQQIETHVRKLYPGFTSQLRGLHAMSELEYQVCLLIKLRITPSDIATVLARDVSTISTVRSRLYKKVFGQKGGARQWDDFILSIGAWTACKQNANHLQTTCKPKNLDVWQNGLTFADENSTHVESNKKPKCL